MVTAVMAEVGQVMAAGQPVLTLAHDGAREVKIAVPEGLVGALKVGDPARVRLWSAQDVVLSAAVREVSPVADAQTRTYAVKVQVEGEAARLPLGATATVALGEDAASALVLPLRAVGEREGAPVVWLFDEANSTVSPVAITVSRFAEDGAHVTAGVQPGARVVAAGIHLLRPGQNVVARDAAGPVMLDAAR